jgi:hypothetical protein
LSASTTAAAAPSPAAGGEDFQGVIIEFLLSRGGKSSTQEIMDYFKSRVSKDQSTAFSMALSQVSKFDKELRVWCLKQ